MIPSVFPHIFFLGVLSYNVLWVLKGQYNEIFDLQFFSLFQPAFNIFDFGKVFAEILKFFCISPGYDTAQSQSPRCMILRGVILCILRRVNRHSLKPLQRPLEEKCHKIFMDSYYNIKGLPHFSLRAVSYCVELVFLY